MIYDRTLMPHYRHSTDTNHAGICKELKADVIKLTLPFPPALNNMYPTNKQGGRYLSQRGKDFKKAVSDLFYFQKVPCFEKDLAVKIELYRPKRIGDIDGYQKPIFDSLKGHCFVDDRQIVEMHIFRFDDAKNPRVEIEIREITK